MVDLPSFQDYLNAGRVPPSPTPTAPTTPPATGTGNWLTSGLGSGLYGALGDIGSAGQAVAKAAGFDDAAQSAADFAQRQRETAATYANPQYEEHPWSLGGLGYQIAQGVPAMAGMIGAGALATAGAPEEAAVGAGLGLRGLILGRASARGVLGAGVAAYPLAVGQNVQRAEDYQGDLSTSDARKALAYGVPEAVVQGVLPGRLEEALGHGVGGDLVNRIVRGAATGAGVQAGAGALTELLTQQMGDPDRGLADRAQSVVQSALGGAFQGAVFGGALHALAKQPVPSITSDQLSSTVDEVLSGKPPPTQPTNPVTEAPPMLALPPPKAETGAQQLVPARPTDVVAPPTPPEPEFVPTVPDPTLTERLARVVRGYDTGHLADVYNKFLDARNDGSLGPEGLALHTMVAQELQRREAQNEIPMPQAPAPTPTPDDVRAQKIQQVLKDIADRENGVQDAPAPAPEPQAEEPPAQTPKEINQQVAQEPAFDWNAIKKGLRLPKSIADQDFQSLDDLRQSLGDHIDERDQAGRDPTKTVLDLAKKIGALDENGQTLTSKARAQAPKVSSDTQPATPPAPITPPVRLDSEGKPLTRAGDAKFTKVGTKAEPPAAPPPVVRAPPKDVTMSPQKQAIHDMVEKARALGQKIGNDPDYVTQLSNEADRIQSNLRNSTRSGDTSPQSLGKAARSLLKDATARSEAKAPAEIVKNDDYYTKPVAPDGPPTPQVLDDARNTPRPKEDAPVEPAPEPAPKPPAKPRTQKEAEAQKIAPKSDAPLTQRIQDFVASQPRKQAWISDVRKAFPGEKIDEAIEELHNVPDNGFRALPAKSPRDLNQERRQGGIDSRATGKKDFHLVEQEGAPKAKQAVQPKTRLERVGDAVKTARNSLLGLSEKLREQNPSRVDDIDKAVEMQNQKLLNLLRAVKSGDTGTLKGVPENYFLNEALDNMNFGRETERTLAKHYATEDKVLQEIRKIAGPGPKPELQGEKAPPPPSVQEVVQQQVEPASPPKPDNRPDLQRTVGVTQHEIDLVHWIHNNSDNPNIGKEFFKYLARNGSSAQIRELSDILSKTGVNPNIRLGGVNDPAFLRLQAKFAGLGRVDASYEPGRDAIALHTVNGAELKLLHEGVHAATMRAIKANGPAAQMLGKLFVHTLRLGGSFKEHYGMYNVAEFVSEGMSNPKFQRYLMGLDAPKGWNVRNMWEAFKRTVGEALGITRTTSSVFDALMDITHGLMQENGTADLPNAALAVASVNDGLHEVAEGSEAIYRRTYDAMKQMADGKLLNTRETWRKQALGWMTSGHIGQVWGKLVPALKTFVSLQHHDSVRSDTFAKHAVKASMALQQLAPDVRHQVEQLMARSVQNIDPRFQWNDQPWLHSDPNALVLQREVAQANNDWNNLKRKNPEAIDAYEMAHASNDADRERHKAQFAINMIRQNFNDKTYQGFESDPFTTYENRRDLHDDPFKTRAYWQKVTFDQKTGMTKLMNELSGDRAARQAQLDDKTLKHTPEETRDIMSERARLSRNYDTVKSMIDGFNQADKRAAQGVYFHLGRTGTHFVAGHISIDPTGEVNSENASKLDKMIKAAGFNDAMIMKGAANTSVYVRVRDADEMHRLRQVFLKAQEQGVLSKNNFKGESTPVEAGEAHQTNIYKAISPVWMKRLLDTLHETAPDIPEGADPATQEALRSAQAQQVRDVTRIMLNMTPENSLSRIYAHRENVQGFSPHMIQSFQTSAVANARGTSRLSLAEDMSQAMRDIKEQVRANNGNAKLTSNQILGGAQAAAELILREKNRETNTPATFMDGVRQMTHTFQVGSSPTYMFTLMTQIPTLSLPELAKTHGFASSSLSLVRAAPEAFKILKAVWSGDDWSRFGMRQENLEKAGLSKDAVDFHMKHAMMGDYHHSSYTQAMTGHGPLSQGKVGKVTTAANALGLYSEMMPRVLTAIAARELYKTNPEKARGMTLDDFVSQKVSGSQMDWSPSGNARQTTRQGMFGAMSPLINQFMGFQIRLTEKLYREVADAYGAGRTPEEKAGAKRFLLGHAAAVTMFAGTLGLPLLSTAASVYDRLKDLVTGEDNNDVIASYRAFLADTFGKETAEVIARGLPRAFGADFDHVGEGRIVPGSSFVTMMTEKRSLEDAEKDWLKSEAGSATGFLMNIAAASRDFSNGDYMNGLIKMAPEALKSPAEAWRIADRGFVDKNGQKLPITANAFDIAMKALGIDPAKEAEYDEVKRTATGLNTMRQLREKNITQHLMLAQNRGDPAMFSKWLAESQNYAQEHPGMLPPAAMLGRSMQKSAQQGAIARGLGLPMGDNLRDLGVRGMTGFGNFRNQ